MFQEIDYCDYAMSKDLADLGYNDRCHRYFDPLCKKLNKINHSGWSNEEGKSMGVVVCPTLYEAQHWLMTQGIYISPRIYLYHDEVLGDETSWECSIYYAWSAIKTIGKSLSYQDALKMGIKDAIETLKNKKINI